jgi:hypothetical protein
MGFGAGGMMSSGMMGMMMRRRMEDVMGGQSGFGGMGQMLSMRMSMMGGRRAGEMGGMMAYAAQPERTGIDKRNVNRADEREKKEKAVEEARGPSLFDPFFDIVQVTVYGQARFFLPPPETPAAEPSLGETQPTASAAAPGATSPVAESGPQAKPEATQPAAASPAPVADAAKPAEAAAPVQADASKAETPKAETPKAETPKTETKDALPK